MNNGFLTIIRGIPGSGKSTYAKKLIKHGISDIYFEADMYFEKNGKYVFDRKKLADAHAWCLENVKQSLLAGKDVIVSNTFTRLFEMEPYISFCRNNKIDFKVLRMKNWYGSIHGVPEQTIQNMRNRFEDYPDEIFV